MTGLYRGESFSLCINIFPELKSLQLNSFTIITLRVREYVHKSKCKCKWETRFGCNATVCPQTLPQRWKPMLRVCSNFTPATHMDNKEKTGSTCAVAVVGGATGSGGATMVFSLFARRRGWGWVCWWGSDMFTDKPCPLSTRWVAYLGDSKNGTRKRERERYCLISAMILLFIFN